MPDVRGPMGGAPPSSGFRSGPAALNEFDRWYASRYGWDAQKPAPGSPEYQQLMKEFEMEQAKRDEAEMLKRLLAERSQPGGSSSGGSGGLGGRSTSTETWLEEQAGKSKMPWHFFGQ